MQSQQTAMDDMEFDIHIPTDLRGTNFSGYLVYRDARQL